MGKLLHGSRMHECYRIAREECIETIALAVHKPHFERVYIGPSHNAEVGAVHVDRVVMRA
ncbi:hypothetical protein D3C87_1951210 [compost metagenome]